MTCPEATSSASDVLVSMTDAEFAEMAAGLPPAEREALGIMRGVLLTLQAAIQQADSELARVLSELEVEAAVVERDESGAKIQ